MIDFATLERPATPNTYLVCTPELCRAAHANEASPVFGKDVATVRAALAALVPDATFREDGANVHASWVAVTRIMRFRDDVDVLLAPTSGGGTQVAIYSRSRIGYGDMGANRKRVQALLAALRQRLGA